MARRSIKNLRVAITGCSGGIGRALAIELARGGARLVINARRREKLESLAQEVQALGGQAEIVAGDVTDAGVRRAILDAAQSRYGGLDTLVNNAGIGGFSRFDAADEKRLRDIFELNFFAAVELTRAALPLLRSGVTPIIVNISSVLGHRAIPLSSEYCASKFAIAGFSESLRAELAGEGIGVLVVSPGTTDTEFFDNVVGTRQKTPWEQGGGATPESVARETVRAIERGKHEIIPSASGRWLVRLNRFFPRLTDWIMQRQAGP